VCLEGESSLSFFIIFRVTNGTLIVKIRGKADYVLMIMCLSAAFFKYDKFVSGFLTRSVFQF